MRRSNTVRIIAGKETKAKLTALGKAFVNCWNEVNMFNSTTDMNQLTFRELKK